MWVTYQLRPVKGTPLFADGGNLWEGNFEVAQLTQVVRQENAEFAGLLNRLRVRKKKEPLSSRDILTLKQRETGEDPTDIHIYATNTEVDKYNVKRLQDTCPDAVSIQALDFLRNPKTGRMERIEMNESWLPHKNLKFLLAKMCFVGNRSKSDVEEHRRV